MGGVKAIKVFNLEQCLTNSKPSIRLAVPYLFTCGPEGKLPEGGWHFSLICLYSPSIWNGVCRAAGLPPRRECASLCCGEHSLHAGVWQPLVPDQEEMSHPDVFLFIVVGLIDCSALSVHAHSAGTRSSPVPLFTRQMRRRRASWVASPS